MNTTSLKIVENFDRRGFVAAYENAFTRVQVLDADGVKHNCVMLCNDSPRGCVIVGRSTLANSRVLTKKEAAPYLQAIADVSLDNEIGYQRCGVVGELLIAEARSQAWAYEVYTRDEALREFGSEQITKLFN